MKFKKDKNLPLKVARLLRKWFGKVSKPWQPQYKLFTEIWNGRLTEQSGQLPLTILERIFMSFLVIVRSFSLLHIAILLQNIINFITRSITKRSITKRSIIERSTINQLYVIIWLIILFVILILNAFLTPWLVTLIVVYRLIDIFIYRLYTIFVVRLIIPDKTGWDLKSLNRSLVSLFINYLEIIFGFASLYLVTDSVGYNLDLSLSSWVDALYFSVITITTLGYGDIKPIAELGKWLTLLETMMGFILVVLVLGSFLAGVQGIDNLSKKQKDNNE